MRKLMYLAPLALIGCDKAEAASKVIDHQDGIMSVVTVASAVIGQPWVIGVAAGIFAMVKGWHKPALTAAGSIVGSVGDGLQNGTPHVIGVVANVIQHVEDFLKSYGTPKV